MATTNKYLKGDLPLILSTNIPTALVRYQREDFAADYAIGNTPWISAASDASRVTRITTAYQKERIDQSATTGEQSLTNWWLRSATSWHNGAGERYYDADTGDLFRFWESNNIDVWTEGELKLLPAVTKKTSVAAHSPVTVTGGTFYISNGNVWFYSASTGTATAYTIPSSGVPYKLATDGTYALIAASNGIYDMTTAGVFRKLYDLPNYAGTPTIPLAIAYVKDRIIAAFNEANVEVGVYEVAREYVTPTHRLDAGDERWETKSTSVVVNSITEFPSAVIVGYTEGVVSRIQAYTINPASPLAALNEPTIIGELPRGETLNQIRVYLNTYVVMATSKGLRIGTIGADGASFTYGPLNVTGAVSDIAFDESYVYACRSELVSGNAGLWRINLGNEVGNAFAYAADLVTDANAPTGVSFIGTTGLKFITSSSGTFVEEATIKATSGYLKSGWIRWGTSEKKQPVSINIKSDATKLGTLGFSVTDQEEQSVNIGAIPLGMGTDIAVSASLQPADHFEITFNFTRDATNTSSSPVLEEWQIRALPAPFRSRTFTVPMLCYEEERDSNGVTKTSNPWERIRYLESIEQNGGAVLYQDFSSGEERICVIRAVQFEQSAPPTFANGFGGILTIQLQTIDAETVIQ